MAVDRATCLGRGVREIWRDDELWALDKPAGVLSHPNPPSRSGPDTLLRGEYDFERELYRLPRDDGATERVWLVHRLDRDTSGVIVCALSQRSAAALKDAFQRREVEKEYRALVLGIPADVEGEWHDHLERSRRVGRVEVSVGTRGQPNATTAFRVIRQLPAAGVSLLSLQPREGRTHQIRVQCARHGHPIAGDDRYGDFTANRHLAASSGLKRMFLCAHRLALSHPVSGEPLEFRAEMRPELVAVLGRLEHASARVPRRKQPPKSPRRRSS